MSVNTFLSTSALEAMEMKSPVMAVCVNSQSTMLTPGTEQCTGEVRE